MGGSDVTRRVKQAQLGDVVAALVSFGCIVTGVAVALAGRMSWWVVLGFFTVGWVAGGLVSGWVRRRPLPVESTPVVDAEEAARWVARRLSMSPSRASDVIEEYHAYLRHVGIVDGDAHEVRGLP
jgi:hypothetical protein